MFTKAWCWVLGFDSPFSSVIFIHLFKNVMEEDKLYIISLEEKIESLIDENLNLKDKVRFSKENELLEFIKTFYDSVIDEIDHVESKLTKDDILKNMKFFIEDFVREYKISLK